MSAFLGPVHYWLYNKILNLEKLELALKELSAPEPGMLLNSPLEAVIDESRIHQSLQEMIGITETRFAAVLDKQIKDHGMDYVKTCFEKQGQTDGQSAAADMTENSIEAIYKKLNDFILDGMPCDTINNVMDNNSDLVKWRTPTALHKPYWDQQGLNVGVFYQLKQSYITEFIRVFDDTLSYSYTENEGNIIHTISRR